MVTLHSRQIALDPLVVVGKNDAEVDTVNCAAAVDAINSAGGGTLEFRGTVQIEAQQNFTTGNVTLRGTKDAVIVSAYNGSSGQGTPRLGGYDCLFEFRPDTGYDGTTIAQSAIELNKSANSIALDDGDIATHGLSVGDWLLLKSDKPDTRSSGSTSNYGQAVKIANLDASGNPDLVFISTPLVENIEVASLIDIQKVTVLRHIMIEDLVFENPNDKHVSLISFEGVQDSSINGLHVRREIVGDKGGSGGLLMRNVMDVEINDYRHEGVTDKIISTTNPSGSLLYAHQEFYGILFTDLGTLRINNPVIRDTRHSLTTSGTVGNPIILMQGGHCSNKGSAVVDSHDAGFVTLKNVKIETTRRPTGDEGYDENPRGIQMRSANPVIDGCDIWGTGELITLRGDNATVKNCSLNGYGASSGTASPAIGLDQTKNVSNSKILSNVINSSARYGVHCGTRTNTIIYGNKFYDTCNAPDDQTVHIQASDAEGLEITNNSLRDNANVSNSVRHNGDIPTTKARFFNNDCRGYGSGDDGFLDGGTRSDYVTDLDAANTTDA